MIDINFLRDEPEFVKKEITKKKANPDLVDRMIDLDNEWRKLKGEADTLRAEQKKFGPDDRERAKEVKSNIIALDDKISIIEKERMIVWEQIPNIPEGEVPVGRDENDNVVIKEIGKIPEFSFTPKDYLEIAGKDIDTDRAAKISGSRFGYIMGEVAELEMAMFRMAVDTLLPYGFRMVIPPILIRPETALRHGKGEFYVKNKDAFYISEDDLYLVGSSEHSIIPMFMDETVNVEKPVRFLGYSTCFRREAGTYGKDTKGILRVHQFNKLEMNIVCRPEDSKKEHDFMLERQEELVNKLELPYRVVDVCTGDMGFSDARQYDIEVWIPSQQKYRESNSCSNTTDFQSRGLNIGYKNLVKEMSPSEKWPNLVRRLVHTLNATAFSERPIVAMLENFQNEDGSVTVPKALRPYMRNKETILGKKNANFI